MYYLIFEKNHTLVHILIYMYFHPYTLLQVVFQQGATKLSVEKDKTSVVSDIGISFTDPRTQSTFFSTDFENHEFHLPKGVKVLSVKKASTERVRALGNNCNLAVCCYVRNNVKHQNGMF